MKTNSFLVAFLCLTILFHSCSSDDDNGPTPDPVVQNPEPDSEPEVLIGVFKDAEVEGVSFQTATQSGITNMDGEFNYLDGEEVTFKVGDLVIGKAMGQELVTPITLAQTEEPSATIESTLAQNIAALLQTLDEDGDESNGIKITEEVAANMGISNIDFTQPIEAVLADIVLNVVQNTDVEIELVYPIEAAEVMAASLNLDFEAPENPALTSLIPTLRVYLESYEQNYTPASALYKNTFDTQGNLTSIEVLSRYSGKMFYRFAFDSHSMEALPLSGTFTRFNQNGLLGALPNNLEFENQISMGYNQDNQLSTLVYFSGGEPVRTEMFTSYNDANQPLSYFRDLGVDNSNLEFTITWTFTFEDGFIATAQRVFDRFETIDANNSFETVTTRNFVHSYNGDNNLTSVNYTRIFEDNIVKNGVLETYVTEASVMDVFTYDDAKKLTDYVTSEEISPSFGDPFSVINNRKYDSDERILSENYSSTSGFESTTNFDQGVRTTYSALQDGLPSSEEEYFADGSSERTNYYYFDGQLVEIEIIEYGQDFLIETITREFYDNGALYFVIEEEYVNGYLDTLAGYDADDNILYIDYFDETGFITMTEFYFEGQLSSIQEFEYDSNGFVNRVVFKDAEGIIVQINNYVLDVFGNILSVEGLFGDGSPWFNETWEYDANGLLSLITVNYFDGYTDIYFYEEGVLVRGEFYDAEGNLYDTIDYTTSGKVAIPKTLEKPIKENISKGRATLRTERNRDFGYDIPSKNISSRKVSRKSTKNGVLINHLKATSLDSHVHKK